MIDNPHLNDRDLKALASEIDRLAMQDRGGEGLEARIVAASLPVLQGARAKGTTTLRLVGENTTAVPMPAPATLVGRQSTSRLAMRIAAGFAVAATAGIAWLGTHRPSGTVTRAPANIAIAPNVSTTEDAWAIADEIDDDFSDQINSLSTKASDLRDDLDSIGTGDSYEEAM